MTHPANPALQDATLQPPAAAASSGVDIAKHSSLLPEINRTHICRCLCEANTPHGCLIIRSCSALHRTYTSNRLNIPAPGLLANDKWDCPDGSLTLTGPSKTANGLLAIDPKDGSFSYIASTTPSGSQAQLCYVSRTCFISQYIALTL